MHEWHVERVPIGYFFVKGTTVDQKCSLVTAALHLLHGTGARVIALTCDGANLSVYKKLGCNTSLDSIQSWFPHPETQEKVFAFPDPCHMIKLMRNLFERFKILIDGLSGKCIKWEYINRLHNLQKHEMLHVANKLRSSHVYYKKN